LPDDLPTSNVDRFMQLQRGQLVPICIKIGLFVFSGVFGGGCVTALIWSDRNFFANFALFCRLHYAIEP